MTTAPPPITVQISFVVAGLPDPVSLPIPWWSSLNIDERICLHEAATSPRGASFPTAIGPSMTLPESTLQAAMTLIRQRGYERQVELAEMGFVEMPKAPPAKWVDNSSPTIPLDHANTIGAEE